MIKPDRLDVAIGGVALVVVVFGVVAVWNGHTLEAIYLLLLSAFCFGVGVLLAKR